MSDRVFPKASSPLLKIMALASLALIPLHAAAQQAPNPAAQKYNLHKPHTSGELIIKLKPGTNPDSVESIPGISGPFSLQKISDDGVYLVKFDQENVDLLSKAQGIAKADEIVYVQANNILTKMDIIPNDPSFGATWGLHNRGQTGGKSGADIQAPAAWSVTTGSKEIVVGVIDTGIDASHPDLADNMWVNPGESGTDSAGNDKKTNNIDDDGNGYVDDWRGWNFVADNNNPHDDQGHGTHVAGTIGARGNNGVGVAGVAWEVSLVGLKFLDAQGSGTTANAIRAVEYAAKMGFQITNNSWGGGGYSQALFDAIEKTHKAGSLFVAAAGNERADNDSRPSYPASYNLPNIISVAATDHNDIRAAFSNFGMKSVHLAAPGVNILSTTPGNRYASFSGTSMAAPHVAGAAVLVWAANPNYDMERVRDRLIYGAESMASLATTAITSGRLNAAAAVVVDEIPPSVPSQAKILRTGANSLVMSWNASGDDGEEGRARSYQVRVSSTPIQSETDWNSASPLAVNYLASGDVLRATVSDLEFGQKGFISIRAMDKAGNFSEPSKALPFHLPPALTHIAADCTSMRNLQGDAPWGIETLPSGEKVCSDSPNGLYENNANTSLILGPIPAGRRGSHFLTFEHFHALEQGYDFGHIEVSSDGGQSWRTVRSYTNNSGWKKESVSIDKNLIAGVSSYLVRFRLTSDSSLQLDGWKFKNIKVIETRE